MPLVEQRPAAVAASFPSTASSGPINFHTTTMPAKTTASYPPMSSSSSTSAPPSPDAVSAIAQPKPPVSPPHVIPAPLAQRGTPPSGSMPPLVRLPSLVTRTNQALHIRPQAPPSTHRPSVVATPLMMAPPTTTALPPSPPGGTAEPPSPRELAARLALLLHARECCTPLDMERVCGVRNCRVARGVLDHCQECFLPEGQCHRSCSEAKQLLRHFRVCRATHFQRACAICDLLRTDFAWAMRHARSLTPLFVPHATTTTDDVLHQPPYHHHAEPQRRHSSYQPEAYVPGAAAALSLRRSVSEGPHHHAKRSAAGPPHTAYTSTEPTPTVKRVRIVTPTEEAEARARYKDQDMAQAP